MWKYCLYEFQQRFIFIYVLWDHVYYVWEVCTTTFTASLEFFLELAKKLFTSKAFLPPILAVNLKHA